MAKLIILALTAFALALQATAAPPTPAQLSEKFKAGDYRGALEGIAAALALRGGAAEGYDRYELLMLKGESLVQLGSAGYAADAFGDAAAATPGDVVKMARARANELIIGKSLALKYVPRSGAEQAPIDLRPADSRVKAMSAMRADLLARNKGRIDAARSGQTLEPTLALLPTLREIAVLEMGATGTLAEGKPLFVEIGTHARTLMTAELKQVRGNVEALNDAANEITGYGGYVDRRGLFTKDRRELAATTEYLKQIESVAREGRRIATMLGGAVEAWERIVTDSGELVTRIDQVLRRN